MSDDMQYSEKCVCGAKFSVKNANVAILKQLIGSWRNLHQNCKKESVTENKTEKESK